MQKLINVTEQYQNEYILNHEREIKLDFYEKSKGLCLLSDLDLTKLEDYILDFGNSLKGEKDRRNLLQKLEANGIELPSDAAES